MAREHFEEGVREAAAEFVGAVVGGDEQAIRECGNGLALAYRACVEATLSGPANKFWMIPSFASAVSSPLEAYRKAQVSVFADYAYWERECSKHCASALEGLLPALDDVVGDMPFGMDMKLALIQAATGLADQVKRERAVLHEKMSSRVANAGGGVSFVSMISMRTQDMFLARAERAIANGSITHSDHFANAILQTIEHQIFNARSRTHPPADLVNAFILAANQSSRFGESGRKVDDLRGRMADVERHVREPEPPQRGMVAAY